MDGLTYATVDDWREMIRLSPDTFDFASVQEQRRVKTYLRRATTHINRYTRREFYPWRQQRDFAVPYQFVDLNVRRASSQDIYTDTDLLEAITIVDGDDNTLVEGTDFFLQEHNIYPKFAIALLFPNYWSGRFSTSQIKHMDQIEVNVTGIWGYHNSRNYPGNAWLDTDFDLTGTLAIGVTTLTVPDSLSLDEYGEPAWVEGNLLKIDDEFLRVDDVNYETHLVTFRRGVRGTTEASHASGASVFRWRVVEDIVEACLEVAKGWREADIATGGRIGANQVSVGVPGGVPRNAAQIIRTYARRIITNTR